jgi:hypothetical protein
MHGGKTPGGIASVHFKHGKRSRYLKHLAGQLRDGYRAALDDPELLAVRDEIALLQARVVQLLDELADAVPPPWAAAVESLNDLVMARTEADRQAKLAELQRIVRQGTDAAAAQGSVWAELRRTIALKAKLAGQEQERAIETQALLPVSVCVGFANAMLLAVKSIIGDGEQIRQVQERVLAMLPGEVEAGEGHGCGQVPPAAVNGSHRRGDGDSFEPI